MSLLQSLLLCAMALGVPVGPDGIAVEGDYLHLLVTPATGAVIEECVLTKTNHDIAGAGGLLQEGFGVGSFYAPNRRLNEKLEVLDSIQDRPVIRYVYDCEGPNIQGIHVSRTMEPMVGDSTIKVSWKIENKGKEEQWISPWIKNDVTVGGAFGVEDVVNLPTFKGIARPMSSGWFAASRNWAAVTDPKAKETFYGVFNADDIHSFQAIYDHSETVDSSRNQEGRICGFQAAFVPRFLKPGATWETVYYLNVIQGLEHVDFASEEIAVQLDHIDGQLILTAAAATHVGSVDIEAVLQGADGKAQDLDTKSLTITPGAPARVSWSWSPSAGASNTFLGRLLRDGKPTPLGKNTGSPHGGVDTVISVDGKPIPMEPWTDAPYSLTRGPRTLKRALAVAPESTSGALVWFEPALEKLFRFDTPESTGAPASGEIALAGNERESIQLAIHAPRGQAIRNVTVSAAPPLGETGAFPASSVTINRVGYYPVTVPTHFENPTGDYPDPLPVFAPFNVPAGETRVVWLTIYAPPGTPAGAYKMNVTLVADGMDPVMLAVNARVFAFDLPVVPALKTDIPLWVAGAETWTKAMGGTMTSEALLSAYAANASEHRVTLRDAAQLPKENPDYPGALKRFGDALPAMQASGATCHAVPPSLLDMPDQLKQAAVFTANTPKLKGKVFCPMANMPPRPAWPRLVEQMQLWKAVAPDIPLMVTTFGLDPLIPDMLDIWAVHLPMLDTVNNAAVLNAVKNGKEVWWFVNHEPSRPYGNLFVDFAAIEHRILFWQTWALGIKGFHYGGLNMNTPGENPYQNQLDVTPANGNHFLVYPSANGPVNSIRWEIIRDGIEDYDYLVLFQKAMRELSRKGSDQALFLKGSKVGDLKDIVPNLVSFSRDPDVLLKKRDEIGSMIEQLHTALGGVPTGSVE